MWTKSARVYCQKKKVHIKSPCDVVSLFGTAQVILSLYKPIVFANYSLGETEVSRTAAVYSEDSLLFVVGNKVHLEQLRHFKQTNTVSLSEFLYLSRFIRYLYLEYWFFWQRFTSMLVSLVLMHLRGYRRLFTTLSKPKIPIFIYCCVCEQLGHIPNEQRSWITALTRVSFMSSFFISVLLLDWSTIKIPGCPIASGRSFSVCMLWWLFWPTSLCAAHRFTKLFFLFQIWHVILRQMCKQVF